MLNSHKWPPISGLDIICISISLLSILIPICNEFILKSWEVGFSDLNVLFLSFVAFLLPIATIVLNRIYRLGAMISEFQDDSSPTTYVGNRSTIMPEICREILSASLISNTFINMSFRKEDADPIDALVSKTYKDWMTSHEGGVWTDIVGIEEYFSGRFEDIAPSRRQNGVHGVYVMREGSYVLNFIILGHKESEKKTVYFGWLPERGMSDSEIFKTSDKKLVGLFVQYFETLKAGSWNCRSGADQLPYPMRHNLDSSNKMAVDRDLVDKKGSWVSVAFDDPNDRNSISSVAFIRIRFVASQAKVEAQVFDTDGRFKNRFSSRSNSTFFLNNVYVSYKLEKRRESEVTGICHYQFHRHGKLGEVINGVFSDAEVGRPTSTIGFRRHFDFDKLGSMNIKSEIADILRILQSKLDVLDDVEVREAIRGPIVPVSDWLPES